MKVKDYAPQRQIILGDFGEEPKVLPKISEEELLAMQPASTQRLMKMKPDEVFIASDDWKREVIERPISAEERATYKTFQRSAQKFEEGFYKRDLTTLIHPDNIDGTFTPEARPRYKTEIAKKIAEPDHPRLAEYKQLKEQWVEMSCWDALKHWFKGGEIRKEDE